MGDGERSRTRGRQRTGTTYGRVAAAVLMMALAASGLACESTSSHPSPPTPPGAQQSIAATASRGAAAGGYDVTIHGKDFVHVVKVLFGGKSAKSFKVRTSTLIYAVVPSGVGIGHVVVVVKKGTSRT
jgi:hypothetical protein